MSAPPTPQTFSVNLTDAERATLEQFAAAHNMTLDEAATHAAQQQLQARFVTAKRFNNVSRLPK
jgi:hypothetical protein